MKNKTTMKKLVPLAAILVLFFACEEEKKEDKNGLAQVDSAFAAQQKIQQDMKDHRSTDTLHMVGLPPVFEGDIVFQQNEDAQSLAWQKATGSKYSNAGIIFIRPRDHLYMVMEVMDSVRVFPLTEWVDRGKDDHVALLRLKNANVIMTQKKTDRLKAGVRAYKHIPGDPYFSWGDDALYNAELVWKIYSNILKIDLCEPHKLGDFDLSGEPVKSAMDKKYNGKIPADDKAVSLDDLYHSPRLEVIFEH